MNLSAQRSLSTHIHCPVAYIQTRAWAQIWPSCHRGVQTARNALLCAKASLMCVGWPRQDERGAPLSRHDSPQPEAALCNTEHNWIASSRPKSLPNTTHFKCCHSLPASMSFPVAKRGERTEKVSWHRVSTFSQKLIWKARPVSQDVLYSMNKHWKEGSSNEWVVHKQHSSSERCLLILAQG